MWPRVYTLDAQRERRATRGDTRIYTLLYRNFTCMVYNPSWQYRTINKHMCTYIMYTFTSCEVVCGKRFLSVSCLFYDFSFFLFLFSSLFVSLSFFLLSHFLLFFFYIFLFFRTTLSPLSCLSFFTYRISIEMHIAQANRRESRYESTSNNEQESRYIQ